MNHTTEELLSRYMEGIATEEERLRVEEDPALVKRLDELMAVESQLSQMVQRDDALSRYLEGAVSEAERSAIEESPELVQAADIIEREREPAKVLSIPPKQRLRRALWAGVALAAGLLLAAVLLKPKPGLSPEQLAQYTDDFFFPSGLGLGGAAEGLPWKKDQKGFQIGLLISLHAQLIGPEHRALRLRIERLAPRLRCEEQSCEMGRLTYRLRGQWGETQDTRALQRLAAWLQQALQLNALSPKMRDDIERWANGDFSDPSLIPGFLKKLTTMR